MQGKTRRQLPALQVEVTGTVGPKYKVCPRPTVNVCSVQMPRDIQAGVDEYDARRRQRAAASSESNGARLGYNIIRVKTVERDRTCIPTHTDSRESVY